MAPGWTPIKAQPRLSVKYLFTMGTGGRTRRTGLDGWEGSRPRGARMSLLSFFSKGSGGREKRGGYPGGISRHTPPPPRWVRSDSRSREDRRTGASGRGSPALPSTVRECRSAHRWVHFRTPCLSGNVLAVHCETHSGPTSSSTRSSNKHPLDSGPRAWWGLTRSAKRNAPTIGPRFLDR